MKHSVSGSMYSQYTTNGEDGARNGRRPMRVAIGL